jgi:C-terminal processing protease CtpA/Prc
MSSHTMDLVKSSEHVDTPRMARGQRASRVTRRLCAGVATWLWLTSVLACARPAPPAPSPPPAPPPATAQSTPPPLSPPPPPLASLLGFEDGADGRAPRGWHGGPAGTLFADDKVVHGGKWAARLTRDASSPERSSRINQSLPIDFTGSTVELRGYLKTDSVSDFAALWLKEDADGSSVAFDNMRKKTLTGTQDWNEYSLVLPLHPHANRLFFGVLVSGTGTAWADDLQVLVDGKPVWEAPRVTRPPTPLDVDHAFDRGSGVSMRDLSKLQVDDLVTLGKVWGFLKYHHPAVTSGTRHWDYDLFRVLPRVLAATDRAGALSAITTWVADLGETPDCTACASLDTTDIALKPDLDWISDQKSLGPELSHRLSSIFRNRNRGGKSFYVSMVTGVGNPDFQHELPYEGKDTDAGFRILAVFRFWNMVEYWFPNRDIIGASWDGALRDVIPRVVLADTPEGYRREIMAFIARLHDTHANLWSSLDVRAPTGPCELPVALRFLDKDSVVSGVPTSDPGGLQLGDVVLALDGVAPLDLAATLAPYYASSNRASQLRDFATSMTRGGCTTPASLRVRRGSRTLTLSVHRVAMDPQTASATATHDRPGPAFQMLSEDVGYLKLSSIRASDILGYLQAAANTKGLIVDIRNYPSDNVFFELGGHFVDKPTEFVRFTAGDLENPGAFHFTPTLSVTPASPRYGGKVVILVDEITQSSAEYTAMALRASPNAVVIGSTTAGADGNVSPIALPGGLQTMFSGIGVFYPNRKPTQRIGIVPDMTVIPTAMGIGAGRDELVEAALRNILGTTRSTMQIEAMAKPRP